MLLQTIRTGIRDKSISLSSMLGMQPSCLKGDYQPYPSLPHRDTQCKHENILNPTSVVNDGANAGPQYNT